MQGSLLQILDHAAGAQVLISASYQIPAEGVPDAGLPAAEARELLGESVRIAREAASAASADSPDRRRWVAASVGPVGAARGDGSEYRGDDGLSVAELEAWHRPRIGILAAGGADLLAVETLPSLREVRAVTRALAGSPVPAWITVTPAGGRTRAGEDLAEAFAVAASCPEVIAVGVNCCAPAEVLPAVRLARDVTDKPIVVYPNSGEHWDARRRTWSGDAAVDAGLARSWVEAGAGLIGGCCRVGADEIAALGRALEEVR